MGVENSGTGFSDIVLLIDKPVGITSNDTLNEIKRATGVRKIGHSGTLDKFASGLLVVCTGLVTKFARFFLDHDKSYEAILKLGIVTDTLDTEGAVIEERQVSRISDEAIQALERDFLGRIIQRPPEYSALKIGGKRASDLVRSGVSPVMKDREVVIKCLSIQRVEGDDSLLRAEIICSKGTYIRSLARDIGEYLGTGGHLRALRRTASGNFRVVDALSLDELKAISKGGGTEKRYALSPVEALSGFGIITVKNGVEVKISHGSPFGQNDIENVAHADNVPYLVLGTDKKLIAIVEPDFNKWTVKYLNVFHGI